MIPEIDTQLAAVIKALSDNVLPAVDAGNPMAAEQIQLCLATLGLVKLEQESSGFKHDSDIGYAAGLQAGILQDLNQNASIEAGYRYLRTNASTEMAPHDGGKVGSLDLHSSGQLYLGASYKF